jgi:hypothetical protein
MTEVESVVEPYSILDYFRRESVSFVHIRWFHGPNCRRMTLNLSVSGGVQLSCQYRKKQ